jgi:GT2 family glycosyltransferase
MPLSAVVIIATKGRPQEVSNLIDVLTRQTVPPDRIIVSACDPDDVPQDGAVVSNIEVIFGPPGLPAQRNRALSSVRGRCDIVIFFDDDFIPSRYWIERTKMLFAKQSDFVSITGQVLADGVTTGGIEPSVGRSIVCNADSAKKADAVNDYKIKDGQTVYGCNMAFRAKSIEHLRFDERLLLYGWLEDRDFGFRAGAEGRIIWTDAIWGVHLGAKRERVSGLKFGYSQVVNPWYLMTKGSMTRFAAWRNILRGLAANAIGLFLPNSQVDRWGRLKGNIVGVKELMYGRWAPERISEL